MKALQIENLTKKFTTQGRAQTVLEGVSYTFKPGVSYALVGSSGSGKSTLLHLLAGFESPDSGSVLWDGKAYEEYSSGQREAFLATQLGFVFQFHYLIDELSVFENVMIRCRIRGEKKETATLRVNALLKTVGLHAKASSYPPQLSGGEQQRVAVARALVGSQSFVLADEPTGNLDAATGSDVINLLIEHQQQEGVGLIIATHDPAICERVDVVLELHEGQLHERKA